MRLHLIRNAHTLSEDKLGIVRGRQNGEGLSAVGRIQAHALGERFREEGVVFDKIFCSNEARARETADVSCERMGFPQSRVALSNWLLDRSMGLLEGQKLSTLEPSPLMAGHWHHHAPQGESPQEVENRMYTWVMNNVLDLQGDVAVYTHDATIKAFLRRVLRCDPLTINMLDLKPTSVTTLSYDGSWSIESMNAHGHIHYKE